MQRRLTLFTTISILALAATAAEALPIIMMTEYRETTGWRNNAIEISNVGPDPGSLAGLTIDIYRNGSSSVTFQIALQSVALLPGGSWVVVSSFANDPALVAAADQQAGFFAFTGDDAIVLSDGGTPIDSIGQVGVDPGTAWGTAPTSTQNATLRRDASLGPDTDPFDPFDPATAWTGAPAGDISGLGSAPPMVPEPTSALLLAGALAAAVLEARRR